MVLLAWQWAAGARFPLHARSNGEGPARPITVLKPVKGCDAQTDACLRSWFTQDGAAPVQILIGVSSVEDPACAVARQLMAEFPGVDAELVLCGEALGANPKVFKLAALEKKARHDILVVSDADVLAPPDLLSQVVRPLERKEVGLVNCFYKMAPAMNLAMRCEAIAINADFWAQVLQSNGLRPMRFALGAVVALRRDVLRRVGGFESVAHCLADDYQLGARIARAGFKIELSPIVVECRSDPMGWGAVWKHQLRWARTIRACQPIPYFLTVLANASLWPLLVLLARPSPESAAFAAACWGARILAALDLKRRYEAGPWQVSHAPAVLLKDLLQLGLWAFAFLGNKVEWRGEALTLGRCGVLRSRPAKSGPVGE